MELSDLEMSVQVYSVRPGDVLFFRVKDMDMASMDRLGERLSALATKHGFTAAILHESVEIAGIARREEA